MSTQTVSTIFAVLAVVAEGLVALVLLLAALALFDARPLRAVRRFVWGYELWLAFLVASIATGGSLYFSQVAGFVPCELCWFQRICMYPLSITLLLAALANDRRVIRYLAPLPAVGFCVSLYHIAVENHWVKTPTQCQIGAGCTVKWINELGYLTIPTLAISAFALLVTLFLFVLFEPVEGVDDGEELEDGPALGGAQEGDKKGPRAAETPASGGEAR